MPVSSPRTAEFGLSDLLSVPYDFSVTMIVQEPSSSIRSIKAERWLRVIPVALIMYTISYIDRTNVSLALDSTISTMMRDLLMDDQWKGWAIGIFFVGYVPLQ